MRNWPIRSALWGIPQGVDNHALGVNLMSAECFRIPVPAHVGIQPGRGEEAGVLALQGKDLVHGDGIDQPVFENVVGIGL